MVRRRPASLLAVAATAAVAATGCGADDHANEPRAATPIELTARVDDRRVVISPTEVEGQPIGAGLANITISNQGREAAQLTFSGPSAATTDPIEGGAVSTFKIELGEGEYEVEAPPRRPMTLAIGPARETAQNELLLP